ncbi:phage capsid protein [Magnetovibrio sp. PR-2]|uniref:phage capsid protein n=1 Tax=Magnetovibrio sp. PR-2 TaxID=3120356 RepID=UPI002FCE1242
MSNTVDQSFITQFQSEVVHTFQQNGSKLRDTVFYKPNVTGSSVEFPVLGQSGSQKNRSRHADLVPQNIGHSNATAQMDNYEAIELVDALDEFKTNIAVRQAYSKSIVRQLGRDMDNIIIEAAINGAGLTTGAAAAFDLAMMTEIKAMAGSNDWDEGDDDRWLVVTPTVMKQLDSLEQFISADYGTSDAARAARYPKLYGFNVVESSRLEDATLFQTTGGQHTCLAYHKNALGLGTARDINIVGPERVPMKNAWSVIGEMSAGGTAILSTGVITVDVTI